MKLASFEPPTIGNGPVPSGNVRSPLGRGLGALIPGGEPKREMFNCPIDQIVPMAGQPRSILDTASLQGLAESIREAGVIQPVLLKRERGRYQLIAGERRWRAAMMAGLTRIPAVVKAVDDDEAFALALIENVQREDLTPLEEARAYKRLLDEYSFSQADLAIRLGKARSTIANTIRLLDLPEEVREELATGRLSAGHARAVLSVEPERRVSFAKRVVEESMTVRRAEEAARPSGKSVGAAGCSCNSPGPRGASRVAQTAPDRSDLMLKLSDALGAPVKIIDTGRGGRIEVLYDTEETLKRVAEKLVR